MANDTTKVRVGAFKVGGYFFNAPLTATAPTDAATALTGYETLGFISEDGVTITPTTETEDIKDVNGDVVRTVQTEVGVEVTTTLMETNEVVLKALFGEDNVTVDGGKITVKYTGEELPHQRFAFELKDGPHAGRISIEDGQITTPGGGEQTLTKAQVKSYPITIKCFRDPASNSFYQEFSDDGTAA